MNAKSVADVAAASRPGSLEAWHVHGCTCEDSEDGPAGFYLVDEGCPAHGPHNSAAYRLPRVSFMRGRFPPVQRTLSQRIRDAVVGFIDGWRGAW